MNKKFRVSQSPLWNLQHRYYQQQGLSAWNIDTIPYRATSNPSIAQYYANLIAMYAEDLIDHGQLKAGDPLFIFELGSGSGTFTFHCLQALQALLKPGPGLKLQYIAIDIAKSNVDSYAANSQLAPFIEAGILDCSVSNLFHDDTISLCHSKKKIIFKDHCATSVVIANYIFDSLPIEKIRIHNNQILAGWLTMESTIKPRQATSSLDVHRTPTQNPAASHPLDNLHFHFDYDPIDECDTIILKQDFDIINLYKDITEPAEFEYPVGALRVMDTLLKPNNNTLLICTDKAVFNKIAPEYQGDTLSIVAHDRCFSLTVNYFCLIEYVKRHRGYSRVLEDNTNLATVVFGSGTPIKHLKRLEYFTRNNVQPSPINVTFNRYYHRCYNDFISKTAIHNADIEVLHSYLPFLLSKIKRDRELPRVIARILKRYQQNAFKFNYNPHTLQCELFIHFALGEYATVIARSLELKPEDHNDITHAIQALSHKTRGHYRRFFFHQSKAVLAKIRSKRLAIQRRITPFSGTFNYWTKGAVVVLLLYWLLNHTRF